MEEDRWVLNDAALEAAHAALVSTGVVAGVKLRRREERDWLDCELATFAENRLGEVQDPAGLDQQTRARWLATAVEGQLYKPSARTTQACYWVVHHGSRVGTLALSRICLGEFASAHSLYLRPPYRGRGVMAGVIGAIWAQLELRGLGMQLETPWTWQRAVRFYLRNGFWLRSWKRDLAFVRRPHVPPTHDQRRRSLCVDCGGSGGANDRTCSRTPKTRRAHRAQRDS